LLVRYFQPKGAQGQGAGKKGELLMTKKDIVLKITDATGIKQVDVKKIVQKTFDVIIDSLIQGDKVELRNFGVFKIKERRARFGRNPRTGQSVPVPPRKVVVFKSGLVMKKKVK
jgi:nucleoid DNA-binding protein